MEETGGAGFEREDSLRRESRSRDSMCEREVSKIMGNALRLKAVQHDDRTSWKFDKSHSRILGVQIGCNNDFLLN